MLAYKFKFYQNAITSGGNMELTTNDGQVIEALDCERMKLVVVGINGDGDQVQNPRISDWQFELKDMQGAPEGCPLTLDPIQHQLADFAVCKSCIYSMIAVRE